MPIEPLSVQTHRLHNPTRMRILVFVLVFDYIYNIYFKAAERERVIKILCDAFSEGEPFILRLNSALIKFVFPHVRFLHNGIDRRAS